MKKRSKENHKKRSRKNYENTVLGGSGSEFIDFDRFEGGDGTKQLNDRTHIPTDNGTELQPFQRRAMRAVAGTFPDTFPDTVVVGQCVQHNVRPHIDFFRFVPGLNVPRQRTPRQYQPVAVTASAVFVRIDPLAKGLIVKNDFLRHLKQLFVDLFDVRVAHIQPTDVGSYVAHQTAHVQG